MLLAMKRTKYAADGRKLQENVASGSLLSRRDYVGDFIYETGVLKRILFEGGYADISGQTRTYMFFLKDHLGSVRAVVSQMGAVQQTNGYFPYADTVPDLRNGDDRRRGHLKNPPQTPKIQ